MPKDFLCVSPFIHLNLMASGCFTLCCQSDVPLRDKEGNPMNIRTHTMSDAWHSLDIQKIRRKMLAGEIVPNCSQCNRNEEKGFGSYRTGMNDQFLSKEKNTGNEFRIERSSLKTLMDKPWFFDLRFDNICNLKCVICSSESSSAIEADPVHNRWVNGPPISRKQHRFTDAVNWVNSPSLFAELIEFGNNVRYIQLAGGEPFLSKLAMDWLEYLSKSGLAQDVKLIIYTNLTVFDERIVTILSHFKKIDLILSIDGIGAIYEYVRFPGKWANIEKNALKLNSELRTRLKNTTAQINATMSIYGALHITEVFDFANKYKFDAVLNNAVGPFYVSCDFLPPQSKKMLEDKLTAYSDLHPEFPQLKSQVMQWMSGINAVNPGDPQYKNSVRMLMRFTNDIDKSRGSNFKITFPDLYDEFVGFFGFWDPGTGFIKNKTALGEIWKFCGSKYFKLRDKLKRSLYGWLHHQ